MDETDYPERTWREADMKKQGLAHGESNALKLQQDTKGSLEYVEWE